MVTVHRQKMRRAVRADTRKLEVGLEECCGVILRAEWSGGRFGRRHQACTAGGRSGRRSTHQAGFGYRANRSRPIPEPAVFLELELREASNVLLRWERAAAPALRDEQLHHPDGLPP